MADGTTDRRRTRRAWEAELRRVAKKHAELRALERHRAQLFLEGRALDPPVTFSEMATIAGVTQAAVIQAAKREQARET